MALVGDAWRLAKAGFPYVFGAEDPAEGGFDCSGVIYYLLGRHGMQYIPRTAYEQYRWLEGAGTLRSVPVGASAESVYRALQPGDLLFWEGTYQTGRTPNVSHVMLYMGYDAAKREHHMFGARSGKLRGFHGNSVDVYTFKYPKPGARGRLIGHGAIPAKGR